MGTFSRSVSLLRSSWEVLRQDKELMLLPVLSAIAASLMMLPFLAGAFLASDTTQVLETTGSSSPQFSMQPVGWVLLFIGYLLVSYVAIFFQAALVLAANDRMTGGSPTLGSALSMAAANAGRILPWAVISATVSIIISAIQQRAGIAGRIVGGIAGVAWTLVTLLVVPILVIDQVGVKEALTRSGRAFKQTWGENVVGNGGIGLIGFLGMLAGLIVFGGIAFVGVSSSVPALVVTGIALFAIWAIVLTAFTSAMNGVFRTALYRYAVHGEESPGFTHEQIAGAFRPKGRTGR
ncbi:MAG: DUF6159 family protein [Microthrixaceae bacterium]